MVNIPAISNDVSYSFITKRSVAFKINIIAS